MMGGGVAARYPVQICFGLEESQTCHASVLFLHELDLDCTQKRHYTFRGLPLGYIESMRRSTRTISGNVVLNENQLKEK
ncbi:unnamed protein product [Amoebophrya sp. A120]|nr:unnamed protein product [Amoebophrya sp. A120]|eukprot:GSA120T00022370001.1